MPKSTQTHNEHCKVMALAKCWQAISTFNVSFNSDSFHVCSLDLWNSELSPLSYSYMECVYLCLNYLIHQTACATQSLDNIVTPQDISPKTNGMHQRYQMASACAPSDYFFTQWLIQNKDEQNEASPILLYHHSLHIIVILMTIHGFSLPYSEQWTFSLLQ